MPTVFTHALVGLTGSYVFSPEPVAQNRHSKRLLIGLSVGLAVLPDADGLFLPVIPYAHPLGHRGLSHSLVFALLTGAIAARIMITISPSLDSSRLSLISYFSAIAASHGLLDAITFGGLGVAFFSPFDTARYFFPIRPIPASPIWPAQFIGWRGAKVLAIEAVLIWTLCAAAILLKKGTVGPAGSAVRHGGIWATVLFLLAVAGWTVRLT